MKDVSYSLRVAYINKLKGFVKYNGVDVPIYGRRVPDEAQTPYIYISNQNSINISGKSCFTTDQSVDVEIVWRSETGMEQNILEDLSNQVMKLIATLEVKNNPQLTGFVNIGTNFERGTELTDYDGTYTYLRKILTFSNMIYESS